MAFDAELYEAARILAMAAVRMPDWESGYRRVCRYYSEHFSTPLLDVFDLPVPFVLQHFYEQLYETMEADVLKNTIRDAIETSAERAERMRSEAAIDKSIVNQAKADLARIMASRENKKKKTAEQAKKDFEEAGKKLDGILAAVPQTLAGMPMPDDGSFKIGE